MENGQIYDSLFFVVYDSVFQKTPLIKFYYNDETQKKYRNGGKELIGSRWDNKTSQLLYLSGGYFCFNVSIDDFKGKPKSWNLSFWDVSGCISVYNVIFEIDDKDKDILPDNVFERITEILKDYNKGFIRCSKCKTRIPVSEIAGSYFAGRYCDECWNKRGMKEIEAKETYD